MAGIFIRLETVRHTRIDTPIRADALQYTAYAYNLNTHGVYSKDHERIFQGTEKPEPDALRTPGYPLFLSLLTNTDLAAFVSNTVYIQTLISCIILILSAFLARQVLNRQWALITVLLTAFSPHLVTLSTYILTETLFTFFIILGLYITAKAGEKNRYTLWVLAASILSYAALIRPSFQFFIIFLAIYIWLTSEKKKRTATIVLTSGIFTGLYSIWLARNLITLGILTDPAIATGSIHHGIYPNFTYQGLEESFGYPYRYDPNSSVISSSLQAVVIAVYENFINQPVESLKWYLSKPLYLFQWELVQGKDIFIYPTISSTYYSENSIYSYTMMIMKAIHPTVIWLSFLGAIMGYLPKKWLGLGDSQMLAIRLLSTVYVYFILVHIAAAPFPRYSIPIRPITYILSVMPIVYALPLFSNINLKYRDVPAK